MLFWPFIRATIDVTSSGSEVPRATTVIPITNFGTSKNEAIEMALSTNNSDPKYNPIAPNTKNNIPVWILIFEIIDSSLGIFRLIEKIIKKKSPAINRTLLLYNFFY